MRNAKWLVSTMTNGGPIRKVSFATEEKNYPWRNKNTERPNNAVFSLVFSDSWR